MRFFRRRSHNEICRDIFRFLGHLLVIAGVRKFTNARNSVKTYLFVLSGAWGITYSASTSKSAAAKPDPTSSLNSLLTYLFSFPISFSIFYFPFFFSGGKRARWVGVEKRSDGKRRKQNRQRQKRHEQTSFFGEKMGGKMALWFKTMWYWDIELCTFPRTWEWAQLMLKPLCQFCLIKMRFICVACCPYLSA